MEAGWLTLRFGRTILEYLGCLRKQACILVLGLDNAGKTSHLSLLTDMCDGASRGNANMDLGIEVWFRDWAVKIYDLGPYLSVSHLWREWLGAMRGSVDGVVFVVDASQLRERGHEARELFQNLLSTLIAIKRTDMPVLIVGSKADLPEARGVRGSDVRQALDVDKVSRRGDPSDYPNRFKVMMSSITRPEGFEDDTRSPVVMVAGGCRV